MCNDVLGVRQAVFDAERFGRAIGHADFGDERDMRRTFTREFDLLRLDEDSVGAKPLARFKRAAHEFIVADVADIGLQVDDKWSFVPVSALHFENAKPCLDACRMIWERRDRLEGPGMTLAPKAVHVRVHVFDAGVTVVFFSEE